MTKKKLTINQRPKRVTAQAVADLAGVSRSAVSRAFTPGAYVDAEKRERIHEVAASLGYQPNALAASLQGGRSNLIAIFVGDMRSSHDSEFVTHLIGRLNAENKWPILIDGGGERANAAIENVLSYPLEAIILRGGSMTDETLEQCGKLGIPMISSGRPAMEDWVNGIYCKNAEGMALGAALLVEKGRRNFAYIDGPHKFYSGVERRKGALETLQKANLDFVVEARGDYTVEDGYAAASTILENHSVDAILCANDASAIGALLAVRKSGRKAGEDISIIGFDDTDMAGWPTFDLTTIENPVAKHVDSIMQMLDGTNDGLSKIDKNVEIEPRLVLRSTH